MFVAPFTCKISACYKSLNMKFSSIDDNIIWQSKLLKNCVQIIRLNVSNKETFDEKQIKTVNINKFKLFDFPSIFNQKLTAKMQMLSLCM